jgi:hypothetical protein
MRTPFALTSFMIAGSATLSAIALASNQTEHACIAEKDSRRERSSLPVPELYIPADERGLRSPDASCAIGA